MIRLTKHILINLSILLFISCSSDYQLKQKIAHKWYFEKVEYSESHKEFLDGILDSTSFIIFNSDESVLMYNNFTQAEFEMGKWSVKNDSLVVISPEEQRSVPIAHIDDKTFEFSLQLNNEPEPIDIKLKRKN